MTPDIDLRIATMVRAMRDVVLPAVDPGNSLAREQAALVIGHLGLLAGQWSRAEGYAATCLDDLAATVRALVVDGGAHTQAAAAVAIGAATERDGRAEARYQRLMTAADALVRAADADGTAAFRADLAQALLGFSLRQSRRDRSWFAASGFDLRPSELQPIDTIIAGQRQA